MITIDFGTIESFDEESNTFTYDEVGKVRFEYSLKVLYEWEGRWKKAFLNEKEVLTNEEIVDFYVKMALDPFDKEYLTKEVMKILAKYISNPNTATKFSSRGPGGSSKTNGKIYTAEEIYARMFTEGIPLEFEHRNLNRLLTILRIISLNNSPPEKMSRADVLSQNAKLNAQRKAKHQTKG